MGKMTRNEKLAIAYNKGYDGLLHKYVFQGYIDMYNDGVNDAFCGLERRLPLATKSPAKPTKPKAKATPKTAKSPVKPKATKKSPAKAKAKKMPKALLKPNSNGTPKVDWFPASKDTEEMIERHAAAVNTDALPKVYTDSIESRLDKLEAEQHAIVTTLEALVASLKPSSKASF